DERLVVDRYATRPRHLPDEAADADADRQQIQRRLDQARQEQIPLATVGRRVALHDSNRSAPDRAGNDPLGPRCALRRGGRNVDVDTERHWVSIRRNVRSPHHTPQPMKSKSTSTFPPASSHATEPVVAARHSSTAWYRGDSSATG